MKKEKQKMQKYKTYYICVEGWDSKDIKDFEESLDNDNIEWDTD